jgi:hypothetical protein
VLGAASVRTTVPIVAIPEPPVKELFGQKPTLEGNAPIPFSVRVEYTVFGPKVAETVVATVVETGEIGILKVAWVERAGTVTHPG